jgi:hypothetical protein
MKAIVGIFVLSAAVMATATGCGSQAGTASDVVASQSDELKATIGPQGGELTGAAGTKFEGFHLVIPAGALSADTEISVKPALNPPALPQTAHACGQIFDIQPAGLQLAQPATLTLPFDENVIADFYRFDDEVKAWVLAGDKWSQAKQIDSEESRATFELPNLTMVGPGVNPPPDVDVVRFKLFPNPKFAKCLAAHPDDPNRQPTADVIVVRGDLNDSLYMVAQNIKPGLKFDMFTVERSSLLSTGAPDPAFTNFGLAWYQSDVDARNDARARVTIRTILLDQIFGFDPSANLAPTGTFHVGFWFNDPNDAVPCGFDATKPTPFNGEHTAGPLAMISVPNATTNLGPLCTKPDTSVSPARCSP